LNRIGRYQIVDKIGQGGTSHVYKGFDATLNRYVAVKTISADAADDPTLRKRFEREAQSAARLSHPHIITVFDFGQEADKLFMAMELLEGQDLKQVIAGGRLHGLEEKLEVMSQICEGLAFAHANGIVHRDLKPANIHVLPDGQVKIMDFGLARLSGSDMTRTGLVMGTPHYMSPEQVRGEHVDFRSDVFAVGCVFYEILTGRKPFDADSIHSVLYKVMQEEPRPARALVPGLPGVLLQILEKAMAKSPAQRFAHAGEVGEFLELAREAIACGRGDEPLRGLVPPSALPAPADARRAGAAPAIAMVAASASPATGPRSAPPPPPSPSRPEGTHHSTAAARRGERGGSSRSLSPSRVATPPPRALWYGLGALALLVLGVASVVLRSPTGGGAASGDASASRNVELLMQDVARKKAELARSRLEAGDYEDALEKARDALRYDPSQPDAKAVEKNAVEIRTRVEKAVSAARPGAGPPSAAARAAFWELLQVAPERGEARDFASAYDTALRPEAEQARKLMEAAEKLATAARVAEVDDFKQASRLAGEAQASFKQGRFAAAARDFMRARERFRRAQAVVGGTSAPSP
jgi:serine/threonine protein kinase